MAKSLNMNGHPVANCLKFQYLWSIQDFTSLTEEKGKYIKSTIFSPKENEAMKWRLRLYPRGEKISEDNYLAVYLKLLSFADNECHAKCEFTIIRDSIKIYKKTFQDYQGFVCDGKGWGFKNFISRQELNKHNDKYFTNDTLKIMCKVTALVRFVQQNVFLTTFGNGTQTDVKIVVNGEIFELHQATLASRSPIFAAMFKRAKVKDDKKIRVDINDVDAKSFRDLIRSIYMANAANLTDTGFMFNTEIAKRFKVH